jgi:hypothetical protein
MTETEGFQRKQFAFAAHIRDPEHVAPPEGIEDRRMAIYRELFFNNLVKLLGSTFPVLRKLHGREAWHALVRDFMARHRARTPYFLEIPREFLDYLEKTRGVRDGDFPFLLELAHYEWMELALSISDAEDDHSSVDAGGNLLDGIPVKSVLAWPLSYRYPVHRISTSFLPGEPGDQPTCLVIFRKRDDELEFRELNPVTARLLDLIAANEGDSGGVLLGGLAAEIGFDHAAMMQHGSDLLNKLRADGILLGTRIHNCK